MQLYRSQPTLEIKIEIQFHVSLHVSPRVRLGYKAKIEIEIIVILIPCSCIEANLLQKLELNFNFNLSSCFSTWAFGLQSLIRAEEEQTRSNQTQETSSNKMQPQPLQQDLSQEKNKFSNTKFSKISQNFQKFALPIPVLQIIILLDVENAVQRQLENVHYRHSSKKILQCFKECLQTDVGFQQGLTHDCMRAGEKKMSNLL